MLNNALVGLLKQCTECLYLNSIRTQDRNQFFPRKKKTGESWLQFWESLYGLTGRFVYWARRNSWSRNTICHCLCKRFEKTIFSGAADQWRQKTFCKSWYSCVAQEARSSSFHNSKGYSVLDSKRPLKPANLVNFLIRRYFCCISAGTAVNLLEPPLRRYRGTVLEKIEDRRFFAKERRHCRLYHRKGMPLTYGNVVRTSILKTFSCKNPIDVLEFLRWNINWLDVLSKIWYQNFVDDFLSRNRQNGIFAWKTVIFMFCTYYHFVNWTEGF